MGEKRTLDISGRRHGEMGEPQIREKSRQREKVSRGTFLWFHTFLSTSD